MADGDIKFNKPGESTETKKFLPADTLRPVFLEWARLAHSGESLNDAQQKLLDDITGMLEQNGLFSSPQLWADVVKGTPYDGQTVEHALTAANTGNASVDSILNSVSNRTTNTKSNTVRNQTSVNYVDLPTPEEFLDDFNSAYNIHITGLVETGAIRPEVAAFAREFAPEMLGRYLRERTARLLKGEPLWKVVGTNADNKLIGTRTGRQETSNTIGNEQQQQTTNTTASGGGGAGVAFYDSAGNQVDPTAGTPDGGFFDANGDPVAQAPATAAAAGSGGGTATQNTTYNDTTNTDATEKFNEQEALVTRNKLGIVANLSPLDYLKEGATAQSLNLYYAGHKGDTIRQRETAGGEDSFATRRL